MTTIVRAKAEHLDDAAPLFDAYRAFYGRASDPAESAAFLKERLNKEESVVFLAYEGEAAIGFMQLYPSFSSLSLRKTWILNDLFVAPLHRGKGAASRLIETAFDWTRKTGAKGLALSTARDNAAAQRLYESLGFRRDELFLTYEWEA